MVKLFHSKLFSIFSAVILFFILISLGKEVYRKYQIQKEINSMQEEVKKLEGDSNDLNKLIEYFKSDAFLETEARKKLNLQKPDEKVVVFTDKVEQQNTGGDDVESKDKNIIQEPIKLSNPEEWWNYFFNVTRD